MNLVHIAQIQAFCANDDPVSAENSFDVVSLIQKEKQQQEINKKLQAKEEEEAATIKKLQKQELEDKKLILELEEKENKQQSEMMEEIKKIERSFKK